MSTRDLSGADPATIEHEIVETRASLHRKLDELQHRLNPRERVRAAVQPVTDRVRSATDRVRSATENVRGAASGIDQQAYAGIAALAAVGVGTALAVKGLRRRNGLSSDPITPSDVDLMGE